MILALDVGNTQIYAGVYENRKMKLSFRKNSKTGSSSDEIGVFLRNVLRENKIDPSLIKHIAICCVVPEVIYSLRGACRKYFDIEPFVLQPGVKTGLKVKYKNPLEVGADRIANAIAGIHLYPQQDLIIVDLGTATTLDVVTADKNYLGGAILSGIRINMESLESKTAKLPSVEIVKPQSPLGQTTIESIQSGLYYGHLGSIRELISRLTKLSFPNSKPIVLGTGGFAHLFESDQLFNSIVPDLVLKGLLFSLENSLPNSLSNSKEV
ncbi:MAG TPA: type III pantothenate kinase [Pseudobdellovibrionaceae bacterium]|nr:type III pantothenate kinase [Pseudobdellovibrionaceae bacterium]